MFQVTVVNLTRDAEAAVEGGGAVSLGALSASELVTLLGRFAELDPVQNMKLDPEVRVQNRRDRFVIRTGQKKLFLQDARNLAEPAYALTAEEIIAELDGSAAARRTPPPMPFATPDAAPAADVTPPAPAAVVVERRPPYLLLALTLILSGYIVYAEWAARRADPAPPALTALTPAERQAEDASLTGVYTTGPEPGQHGIIIMGDGKLKLFRVNAQAAPSVAPGGYRYGRLETQLCLATDQPGGLIKVLDREVLEYCGALYRRAP